MNIVAIFHAYKFTHFTRSKKEKTKKPDQLDFGEKMTALFFGVNNPRPENKLMPAASYQSVKLQSNKMIDCWYFKKKTDKPGTARPTIILCHGYGGEKSSLLDKAAIFDSLGFDTFIFDFMGSGGSEGSTTTIGFKEAEQVKTSYDYLRNKGINQIYLFGTSMGAVAIMKAVKDFDLEPDGIIIECPFGTMYQTVAARFKNMNVPAFPMATLLVFWGGVQNGFWAFTHNPEDYAKSIKCPTLLLYGERDKNVSMEEIDAIYSNLGGPRILKTYPMAGHENYLLKYRAEWIEDVRKFLGR